MTKKKKKEKKFWYLEMDCMLRGEIKLFQVCWMIVFCKIWLQGTRNHPASLWTVSWLRKPAFLERGKLLSSSSLWDQWLSKVIMYERESTCLCVLKIKLRWKPVLLFLLQKENCLVLSSCYGYTMNWLWWVTAIGKPKKQIYWKLQGKMILNITD